MYLWYMSSYFFFFSSRRRHTRCSRDWSSDVCSSDLVALPRFNQYFIEPPQVLAARAGQALDSDEMFIAYGRDRKSTRLNSSHGYISYAVFCLKKKKKNKTSKHSDRRLQRDGRAVDANDTV